MAVMVKSGIPISEVLSTLLEQTKSPAMKTVIKKLSDDVENGQSLSKTFAKHPETFSKFYISLIQISEESGSLDENLEMMANELAEIYSLKKKIQGAMLYPGLVLLVATVMGGFISLFILPQLVDFFSAFDIELPVATKILLFFANLMKNSGVAIISGLIVGFFLIARITKTAPIKPHWDALVLKLPLLGGFLNSSQLAQFSKNLGILIKSGVPITESIEITAETMSNLKFRNDLLKIGSQITKGKGMAEAMEKGKYSEFPTLVSRMIGVGEKTGKLDESLLYLSEFYEEEVDEFSKNLTTTLEPVLLIVIGLLVGFLALAIITPIYELSGSIR
jgi:type IV pilus assembly protein PilC